MARRFRRHPSGTPLIERLMERVDKRGPLGCWPWLSTRNSEGYGMFTLQVEGRRVSRPAHRLVWTELVGEIPADKVLDHICRVRHCVRPEHLEIVTFRANVLRGVGPTAQNARRSECVNGHQLTPANLYLTREGHRHCRTCALRRAAEHKQRRRGVQKGRAA